MAMMIVLHILEALQMSILQVLSTVSEPPGEAAFDASTYKAFILQATTLADLSLPRSGLGSSACSCS